MVIFIHVTAAPITNLSHNILGVKILFTLNRMCGVAVHGFVFLSGLKLFLKETSGINYISYFGSRIKRIYIPYLIAAAMYYLLKILRGIYVFDIRQLTTFLIFGNGESHLYFVFVIMQFYILFPLWRYLLNSKSVLFLLVLSAVINIAGYCFLPDLLSGFNIIDSFSYNHGLFTSYIFSWVFGCVCGKYYNEFVRFLSKKKILLGVISLILTCADVYMAYNSTYYGCIFTFSKLIRFLYIVVMICFVYSMICCRKLRILNIRFVKLIDDASFEIYLFHVFIIHFLGMILGKFNISQSCLYIINFLLVYILSITICILYKKMVWRLKK